MAKALQQEVAAFQASISAPTSFAAVCDIIADGGAAPAIHEGSQFGIDAKEKKPCSFEALKTFCLRFDLSKFGIGRDSVVCTAIPNGPAAAVCFWAISQQCVFAPLNPGLTVPEVEFELTDLPCHTMILMDGDNSNNANLIVEACERHNVNVLRLVPDETMVGLFTLKGPGDPVPATQVSQTDLALVLHTSGTTKKPKIVPLTHRNLGNGIQFVASTLRRKKTDLCLNVMPLFHIHGIVANVGVSAYSGSPVIASAFMGGANFLEEIKKEGLRPSWYSAVPTMHEAILLEAEKKGTELEHSLELMRNCSAALLPPVSKRFIHAFGTNVGKPFTVVPTYAMTESFPICSNPPSLEIKLSTVGPAMGPKIKILAGHPDDRELPAGTEGEVCVMGECVTAGYLMRDHMSCDPNIEAFSLPTSSVGRMLRTGDKGYIDEDGYLQLVGRFKEIINCGGEKISPLDMEEELLGVEGVETCVCFASPADLLGEVVGVACVTKAGKPPPTLAALKEGLPGTAMRFKPKVLVHMDAIPKGPTGKPKRIGLAKMLGIPAIGQEDEMTFKIEGKGGDLGELMRLGENGNPVPVWQFPLEIVLDINPDLDPICRTKHKLIVEDSLANDYKLTVTGIYAEDSPEISVEFPVPKREVQEVLEYVNLYTELRGMDWTAKVGVRGRFEDWCGSVTMTDGKKSLKHYWPCGCSDTPPGKLMRLLKVLSIANIVDKQIASGAHTETDSPWYTKAVEQGLIGSAPPTGAAPPVAVA